MLSFDFPWLFLLLPLPLLIFWLVPASQQSDASVRVPFFLQVSGFGLAKTTQVKGRKLRLILLSLCWFCLVSAAASPNWLGDPVTMPSSGRDLLIAVDISESMEMNDMNVSGQSVSRLVAVKAVLKEFVSRRDGDRLGLILLGTQAYLQTPLTFDQKTVEQFLLEAQIGFAGGRTAIGDAIGLAVKRLRQRPGDRHVLVLLTDGANTAGEVSPLVAARLAADNNITIYTVGIGADEMIQRGLFGSRRVNPSMDLDEPTLKEIAELTNGRYFRARNPEELINIYQLLDQLEPIEESEETFRPLRALFYWPLSIALLISLLLAVSSLRISSRSSARSAT